MGIKKNAIFYLDRREVVRSAEKKSQKQAEKLPLLTI